VLAPDVVAVGLGDGPDRHLPHLRPAAHDDDSLPVDPLKRLHRLERPDRVERAQVRDERIRRGGHLDLEVHAALLGRVLDDLDRRDVAPVPGDHAGELVEDAGSAPGANEKADGPVAHDPRILP
jgi:hypothetical protein